MKHLRLFETEAAFEAAKQTLEQPWVALANDVEKIYFGESGEPQPTIEFVDLGLPSGKKWMKYNLGATNETEYGDYYMWGSVTPNTDTPCDWEHAPFNNGQSYFDETYFASVRDTVCPNGVLTTEYDAVYQATNGAAHMPTFADLSELTANTTTEWVTNYQSSGVKGRLLTSKTNGNSIFFPASGYRSVSSFYGQGDDAYVWSSYLDIADPRRAWILSLRSYKQSTGSGSHCDGFSVRGVKD